ncbi:MAG: hypothetical protein V4644_01990 [Patescibacteria group bacterium]
MKLPTTLDLGSLIKRISYGDRIRPSRDWSYLLMLMIALVVASVATNFWMLKQAERETVSGAAAAAAVFDAAPIESVRAVFEQRRIEEGRYRAEYRFVDPSL